MNYLRNRYPEMDEIGLAAARCNFINNKIFGKVSAMLGLHQGLICSCPKVHTNINNFVAWMDENPETDWAKIEVGVPKILSDLFEAVIGAILVDLNFDIDLFLETVKGMLEVCRQDSDVKLRIHEYL